MGDAEFLSIPQVSSLIKDVELLISKINVSFCEMVCCKLCDKSFRDHIKDAIQHSIKALEKVPVLASQYIVKLLTKQCSSHLKLLMEIPRLYRKTNREIPKKPSGYVSLLFNTLIKFDSDTESILPQKWKQYCLKEVTEGIMKQSVTMIQDVLTAIKKMEDSLKILKRARDKQVGHPISGTTTDDDKIRRQLIIDVKYLEEMVPKLGLKIEDLRNYKDLADLIAAAEQISGKVSKA